MKSGTWGKEDPGGKETEHIRGVKLVTGDARVTMMAKNTKHICEERRWLMATSESPAFSSASYAARIEVGYRRRSNYEVGKHDRASTRGAKMVNGDVQITCVWSCVLRAAHAHSLHSSAQTFVSFEIALVRVKVKPKWHTSSTKY